jgi:hypothetical protein
MRHGSSHALQELSLKRSLETDDAAHLDSRAG